MFYGINKTQTGLKPTSHWILCFFIFKSFITSRCYAERGIATASRPYVRDVEVSCMVTQGGILRK